MFNIHIVVTKTRCNQFEISTPPFPMQIHNNERRGKQNVQTRSRLLHQPLQKPHYTTLVTTISDLYNCNLFHVTHNLPQKLNQNSTTDRQPSSRPCSHHPQLPSPRQSPGPSSASNSPPHSTHPYPAKTSQHQNQSKRRRVTIPAIIPRRY
jgi:hypothetical protein